MVMAEWKCKCGHLQYNHENEGTNRAPCKIRVKDEEGTPRICKCDGYQPVNPDKKWI